MRNLSCLTVATLLLTSTHLSAATLYVSLESTNPTPPYTNWATAAATIQDAIDAAGPGDQIWVNDGVYQAGGRVVYGSLTNRVAINKPVSVESVNGPALTIIQGNPAADGSPVRCVYLTNNASLTGFTLTNGASGPYNATTNETRGGGVFCESPTAQVNNCLIVSNTASVLGGGAYGGTLSGCTLRGNLASNCDGSGYYALTYGGAAYGSVLTHCLVSSNYAEFGGGACNCTLTDCTLAYNNMYILPCNIGTDGGGVYGCTLANCLLLGNAARFAGGADASTLTNCSLTGGFSDLGGGARSSTLNNCLVTGNRAGTGGGVYAGTLNNCTVCSNSCITDAGGAYGAVLHNSIIYYNTGSGHPDVDSGTTGSLQFCCTPRLPAPGTGNFTNPPAFINLSALNFRLQTNSPCIDAGSLAYAQGNTDLDGRPRIVGGNIDVGAYEFQGSGLGEFFGWLQHYGLPTDGSADFIDSDGDGMNNWQEWVCGTCPTNAQSALRLLSAVPTGTNTTVTWQSVSGVNYFLERTANLASPFRQVASFIIGQAGTTSYADTNAAGAGPLFYRVGVLPSGANLSGRSR